MDRSKSFSPKRSFNYIIISISSQTIATQRSEIAYVHSVDQSPFSIVILPNESHSIKVPSVSYYAPAMKYLLNGNMWTKYIRHSDYSSEYGVVKLQNILLGEICLLNHHIFLIPLLDATSIASNNQLVVRSNQIESNILVHRQDNEHHTYFVVNSHREKNYSNIFARPMKSKSSCVLFLKEKDFVCNPNVFSPGCVSVP